MVDNELEGVTVYGMKEPFHMTLEECCEWAPIVLVGTFIMGVLCSCSAAGDGRFSEEELYGLEPRPTLSGRCAVDDTFDLGPTELETTVRYSASLWQAAIGRPVCVEKGGIPIILKQDLMGDTDHQLCGFTAQRWYSDPDVWIRNVSIQVRVLDHTINCFSYLQTVLHEMGHALGHRGDHTNFGLMLPYATPEASIDQVAIDYVCKETNCY